MVGEEDTELSYSTKVGSDVGTLLRITIEQYKEHGNLCYSSHKIRNRFAVLQMQQTLVTQPAIIGIGYI